MESLKRHFSLLNLNAVTQNCAQLECDFSMTFLTRKCVFLKFRLLKA